MKSVILRILFALTTVAVIAGWVTAAPVIFAMQIIAGAWRGFRNASYIMRAGIEGTIRKFLEGWKTL